MLYGDIERELAEAEPWLLWHGTNLPPHRLHLVEREQEVQDLLGDNLEDSIEHGIDPANRSELTGTTASSWYQSLFYSLRLLLPSRQKSMFKQKG